MGSIKVKNRTTLTDFSALIRVGLYLAGEVEQATENGFSFQVNGNEVGTIVTITEAKNSTLNFGEDRCYYKWKNIVFLRLL